MEYIIGYFIGWILLSVGYYIYKVYIDKDPCKTKKLNAYHGFLLGIFSWLGIIFLVCFWITGLLFMLNDKIENKLNE